MKLAHIPLTIFTVIGGALAIGVGFGSQNIVNNFISGLILLFERPIKVGDLIEVDGVLGFVEQIGLRSTIVRVVGNRHVIVPNSQFLEKNVLNWTLQDRFNRISIKVGVAYGTDLALVKKTLLESVDQHPSIAKEHETKVYLRNFGDSALEFEVYFWLRFTESTDRFEIESDIRHEIDRRFRELLITIPFPQRETRVLK